MEGPTMDPYLRRDNANPSAQVNVFFDDLLWLAQGPAHRKHQVRRTLFHALEKLFWPCEYGDLANHKELFSLKKLRAGDCMWKTCQILLGWLIDTVNMTLSLPPHRENCSKEILVRIPHS